MRKGAYAGPVTDGKHEVIVKKPPSSRSREIAGAFGWSVGSRSSALHSVSGRTPSAMMMITGTSFRVRVSLVEEPPSQLYAKREPARHSLRKLLANAPPRPIDLSGIVTDSADLGCARHVTSTLLNAFEKEE